MYRSIKSNTRAGFTLVELLVVIAVIGILSAIIMVSANAARANARDKVRVGDLSQLELALRLYAVENRVYPSATYYGAVGEGEAIDALLTPFLPTVPHDPSGPGDADRYYTYSATEICANAMETNAFATAGTAYCITYGLGG